MKKSFWYELQREILEGKGYFKFFVILLILVHAMAGFPNISILYYLPRLVVETVGLILLIIVFFVGKAERTQKENRTIYLYGSILLILLVSAIFWMKY